MKHEAYFSTAAQLLPVVTLAGLLELRQLIKAMQQNGDFQSRYWVTRVAAHVYSRVLALSTLACLALSLECLQVLHTSDEPDWLYPTLKLVLPIAAAGIALPLIGAIYRPSALLSWYDEATPRAVSKKRKKKKGHDD